MKQQAAVQRGLQIDIRYRRSIYAYSSSCAGGEGGHSVCGGAGEWRRKWLAKQKKRRRQRDEAAANHVRHTMINN